MKLMRIPAAFSIVVLLPPLIAADTHHIEVDDKIDFSGFKTFLVREGQVTSRNAELNNKLTLKTIEDAIRLGLSSKGLKETANGADLIVSFNLTESGQRGAPPPGERGAVHLSAGILVVDMTKRDTNSLIWHGIYSDTEESPARLAKRLPGDARKLVSEYPPKKKK